MLFDSAAPVDVDIQAFKLTIINTDVDVVSYRATSDNEKFQVPYKYPEHQIVSANAAGAATKYVGTAYTSSIR